jgi:hypothetical protein
MNYVKTYEGFSENLNEGKIAVQTVTYINFDGSGWNYLASEGGFGSGSEMAETIAHDLNLASGDMYLSRKEFTVKGMTKSGKSVEIKQEGEYDMYGGPYSPKMKKPTIKLDGRDIYSQVLKAVKDNGYEVESGNDLDVLRTDMYSNIFK